MNNCGPEKDRYWKIRDVNNCGPEKDRYMDSRDVNHCGPEQDRSNTCRMRTTVVLKRTVTGAYSM